MFLAKFLFLINHTLCENSYQVKKLILEVVLSCSTLIYMNGRLYSQIRGLKGKSMMSWGNFIVNGYKSSVSFTNVVT